MDVLFLTVSIGGGHFKAAEAIKENIEKKHPGSRCMIIDTLKYIHPAIDKLIIGSYLNTVKVFPQLYGKLYQLSEARSGIYDISSTVNRLLSGRLRSLIEDFKPSVVVCTHPFPLQMLSILKGTGKVTVPVLGILTDFVAHPLWLHNHVDAYVVAHNGMKLEMVHRGVPGEIIHPHGIPMSNAFLLKKDRRTLLEELGLEDKPTLLIMGGSLGFGEILKTFLSLLKCKTDLQVLVVTGKNLKLKKQLDEYVLAARRNIKIFGYTERISDFMDISDMIITKPGGMTVSEALVKKVPLCIISPIPGQEEGNAHFLINNGAAVRILEKDNIEDALRQLIDNPLRMRHMKEMAQHLAKPDSCDHIVDLLHSLEKKLAVNA